MLHLCMHLASVIYQLSVISMEIKYVTRFEKLYLKHCVSGKKRRLHAIRLCIYSSSMHQPLNEYLTELPASLNSFLLVQPIPQALPQGWRVEGGGGGSRKVTGRGYVNTENSQMASIGVIFSSIYHKKQLKSMGKLRKSCHFGELYIAS